MATVKATWSADHIMLFGDSYKSWGEQLDEYIKLYNLGKPEKIDKSASKWVGGSLKWCCIENANHEFKSRGDKRKIENFNFKELK